MQTILETLRDYLGEADFYKILSGNNYTWDYAAMIEYLVAAIVLCITVSYVFRILLCLFKR